MVQELDKMQGPDGLSYGWEWHPDDPFNRYVNSTLKNIFPLVLGGVSSPRYALDIGCGTGVRLKQLDNLGLFDRLYACDIGNNKRSVCHTMSGGVRPSLMQVLKNAFRLSAGETADRRYVFKQKSVVDIAPADFDAVQFHFINCRNVAHFLSPQDFRAALRNIYHLTAESGLVALSFDGAAKARPDAQDILTDVKGFYQTRKSAPEKAAHATYVTSGVTEFMQALGFEILPVRMGMPFGLRVHEEFIFARKSAGHGAKARAALEAAL